MGTKDIRFEDFLMEVEPGNFNFVSGLHEYLLQNGCVGRIQAAKNGYVVSYEHGKKKKVVANYVFRKKGLVIRVYGDHIHNYNGILDTMPDEMVKAIEKAPVCKRLINPEKCNSRCPMGYSFTLNNVDYQKCRYNGFMFSVNDRSGPYIKTFLENELRERSQAT